MVIVDEFSAGVTGGVDTHLEVHVAAVLDPVGGLLGVESFEAGRAGEDKLIAWLQSFGSVSLVGVEGTGSYGAGLARRLRSAEIDVVEVDRPNRQARHRRGKSDPLDAVEAARAAQGGRALGWAKTRDGNVEAIRALVTNTAPDLLALHGVGVDTAAVLLAAAGDNPDRLRSEAAWAHLCGVAPLEASSGKVTRHRLNRGGDRNANQALWRIALTRMSNDPRTRAYVERRTAEGKSKREIMRILKRYIAREVYHHLRPTTP